ncbi:carboxypeptidase-like regulatory domain-containing protein [Flavihumibacter sp. UBA7668]|uniref:carboxypeptidase-like regulatory domain-containing protein n=1 Tax=Flavihumibacter sp. UBA7668 TaxID=1946542 RepID=UPI0025B9F29E|nr:carboxypeptidase-like regulatory domain-containing protein [Flavihumibacter sp. UBA7668]
MKAVKIKKALAIILIAQTIWAGACTKTEEQEPAPGIPPNASVEKGIMKGRVTDANGNAIPNVNLVAEHTVYFGTYIFATSNQQGYYKTTVPNGGWQVTSQIERSLAGQTYRFDLHPDNETPFTGATGAIRNFTWKLSGAKPGGGFYGSSVAVYPEPGSPIQLENIELIIKPDGQLTDGSTGSIITKSLTDIGGGEDGINDIPIGKYTIKARNKINSEALQLRIRNTGSYSDSVTGIFKAGYTGSTQYQIIVQVK